METFSALLAICAGNSPVTGEFPAQRPVTRSFDVFFDLRLNERLSKQLWDWWFETPSFPLWRHSNVNRRASHYSIVQNNYGQLSYSFKTFFDILWTLLNFEEPNTLTHIPPAQDGQRFADDIFICIFVKEKICILVKISLKFLPSGPIDKNPTLV